MGNSARTVPSSPTMATLGSASHDAHRDRRPVGMDRRAGDGAGAGFSEGAEGRDDRARVEIPHRDGEAHVASSDGAPAVGRDRHPDDPLGVGVIGGKDGTVLHGVEDPLAEPFELRPSRSRDHVADHDRPDGGWHARTPTHEVLKDDVAAVGGKRQHLPRMVPEPADDLTGRRIEDRGHPRALEPERHHGGDPAGRIDGPKADLRGAQVEGHRLAEGLRGEVPDPGAPVEPERRQSVAAVVHREPDQSRRVTSQGDQVRSRGHLPHPSRPVQAGRVGQAPVVAERDVGGARRCDR